MNLGEGVVSIVGGMELRNADNKRCLYTESEQGSRVRQPFARVVEGTSDRTPDNGLSFPAPSIQTEDLSAA